MCRPQTWSAVILSQLQCAGAALQNQGHSSSPPRHRITRNGTPKGRPVHTPNRVELLPNSSNGHSNQGNSDTGAGEIFEIERVELIQSKRPQSAGIQRNCSQQQQNRPVSAYRSRFMPNTGAGHLGKGKARGQRRRKNRSEQIDCEPSPW